LDLALREILGTHVEQKGSYVCDRYIRFDFSHFEKMSPEQMLQVEKKVNSLIRLNSPLCENRTATMEQAKEMGAIALFGEKYGDVVRVVKFGDSVELCGGCHTSATGNIGYFKIVSESAIAAGIRRIEAVTGEDAELLVNTLSDAISTAKSYFNNAPDLLLAIRKMIDENDDYKKKLEAVVKEKTVAFKKFLYERAIEHNGLRLIVVEGSQDMNILRNAALMLQKEAENLAIAAAVLSDGKPQLMLMYSQDLVKAGKDATRIVKEAAKSIQGGGGGQPGLATAGGRNADGLAAALEMLKENV
jgi:alanyl-tRNA synthetase